MSDATTTTTPTTSRSLPDAALRHHVSGAIARGEATPIVAIEAVDPADVRMAATCDCGQVHEATYSHEGEWNQGPIWAVVCDDGLTGYYNRHGVFPHPDGERPTAADLGLDLRSQA